MSWNYNQSNGYLSHRGMLVGQGYSGHGNGVNNPAMQNVPNVGPIPQGEWTIGAVIEQHPTLGEIVLPLLPAEGTETFGRSGFFMHGDEIDAPGEDLASHGCIVMPRNVREAVAYSGDETLVVA